MIKNFKKENIGPCSYDLCLGEIFQTNKIPLVDLSKNKLPSFKKLKLPYVLKPGEVIIGRTTEELNTPLDLMAFLLIKSTAFRMGLNILCTLDDPGYNGQIIFTIQNISQNKIKIYRRIKLIQAVFLELKGDSIPIQTRYMGGKII